MAYERRQFSGNAPATTLSGAINNSVTSIPVTDGTGYPDGSVGPFFIVVDRSLATEEKIKCSSRSGNTITASARGSDGTTAQSHASGAVVEHIFTKTDADEANAHYADAGLDHHAQYLNTARHDVTARHGFGSALGTPAAASTSAVGDAAAAGSGTVPSRSDHVHGREAFGTPSGTERPGTANAAGSATTLARSDHAHAMFTAGTATVSASQSTTSTSFTDLATVGPTVSSLTTGTSALVILTAALFSGTVGEAVAMSFTVSGATTLAASDTRELVYIQQAAPGGYMMSAAIPVTLTAGSNTFQAKYASGAGNSVTFVNRSLTVIPLN